MRSIGPQLNKNKYSFSTRDSLGIESVAASMSADVCPIVNTVTPRAFYWPFMVWIYYDFYKYSGITERNYTEFNKYVKRQDYFFVLASLLVNGDADGLVGKTQAAEDIKNSDGPYLYNPKYFKSRFGGMLYYNAGCITMRFVTDRDAEGNTLSFPKLTPIGEELALSFQEVIKTTEYYKSYRLNDIPVPKNVLIEYGKVISLNMKGYEKSKTLLKKRLFEANPQIQKCARYLKYLHDEYGIKNLSGDYARRVFFDHLTAENNEIDIPDDLRGVIKAWEIIIGRMYFTLGLEMIWKPMLELIGEPLTASEWISTIFDYSEFTWDLDQPVESILGECVFDFDTREEMIDDVRLSHDFESGLEKGLENGVRIMLSMYNWLKESPAKDDEHNLLYYGTDNNSIPLAEFEKTVDDYRTSSIKDFMVFIMKNWLIQQHYITAFEKMLYNIDGFFYELVDGKYIWKHDFTINYQGNRMLQLMKVMRDLNMF